MRDVPPWLTTVAFFVVFGFLFWIVAPLLIGRGIAELMSMTCPRCRGGVSWLRASWLPGRLTVHVCFCIRCRKFLRTTKTRDGWVEFTPPR